MENNQIPPVSMGKQSFGKLQISVIDGKACAPIPDASINISYPGQDNAIEQLKTDISGQTGPIELSAPPKEYSLEPEMTQPYSEYTLTISADGYDPVTINGTQILADQTALQQVVLNPLQNPTDKIIIPANTLYENYPPKIPESELKEMYDASPRVLSRVVIPETIVVHTGPPRDKKAKNYYVPYKDYIKNVACSEIYATWPTSTITANVLAIMSFTLNRVYTEWYRNMGYDFTITSSTAYDQYFVPGRNIFKSISDVVDSIFTNYVTRPNARQPLLTQYCDGKQVQRPQWLSQWGSKYLGDQGYSAIEILRYYYGEDIYIKKAELIKGIPSSWPGHDLKIGSRGPKVMQIQEQLNRISQNYPALPVIMADGIYGPATAHDVKKFQKIFGLPASGIVDYPTWFKISEVYVGVSRIAELD